MCVAYKHDAMCKLYSYYSAVLEETKSEHTEISPVVSSIDFPKIETDLFPVSIEKVASGFGNLNKDLFPMNRFAWRLVSGKG